MFSKTDISDLDLQKFPLSAYLNVNKIPVVTEVSENSVPKWSSILHVKMLKWTLLFKPQFSGSFTHSFAPVTLWVNYSTQHSQLPAVLFTLLF